MLCSIFGHRFYEKKRLDFFSRCVGCKRCEQFWAVGGNDFDHRTPWNEDFSSMYHYSPYLDCHDL